MNMNILQRISGPTQRPHSKQRKLLRISVIEGISAMIIANLLGGPILTAYLLYLGGGSAEVGFVMAIPPLANLAQIAAAYYMQRIRNRKFFMTLFSVIHRTVWVATGLIPFLVDERLQIPVFIALFGISFLAASAGGVFWSSLMADFVPAQIRGRYFGIRNTVHWAVASITLLIGGQILERLSEDVGFIVLYMVSAVCTVWNAIELWRYPNPPFEKSGETSRSGLLLKPVKDGGFMSATLFIALFVFIQNIAVPLFSFVMLDILKISYWQVTVITTVQMIVMMISYYFWGNLNARYTTKTLLMWSLPIISLSCAGWIGLEWMPAFPVLILVHILLGIGLGGYNLLAFNFMIGDTPKPDRPMYIAMFSALTGITGFIGPLLGGYIYKQLLQAPFWIQSYGVSAVTGFVLFALSAGLGPFVLGKRKRKYKALEVFKG